MCPLCKFWEVPAKLISSVDDENKRRRNNFVTAVLAIEGEGDVGSVYMLCALDFCIKKKKMASTLEEEVGETILLKNKEHIQGSWVEMLTEYK